MFNIYAMQAHAQCLSCEQIDHYGYYNYARLYIKKNKAVNFCMLENTEKKDWVTLTTSGLSQLHV